MVGSIFANFFSSWGDADGGIERLLLLVDIEGLVGAWLRVVVVVLLLKALSARGKGGIGSAFRVVVLAVAGVLAALPAGSVDVLALEAPGVFAPPGRVTRFSRSSVR